MFLLLAACSPNASPSVSVTPGPTRTLLPATATVNPSPVSTVTNRVDPLVVLSLFDGWNAHLFTYSTSIAAFTQLTADPWDDITPAISPDGKKLAFASRRNGYWDLYLLNLETGETTRLTDTPEYEAAPSWSPDGRWLVHEMYIDGNLELVVRSVTDLEQAAIRLTESPAADHSPDWSPQGRQIAFVSNRGGESEIWIADLDKTDEDRYLNVSNNTRGAENLPAWSPDGMWLAWSVASYETGLSSIVLLDNRQPQFPPRYLGDGNWPVWLDSSRLLTRFSIPNQSFFNLYAVPSGEVIQTLVPLPGTLRGLAAAGASLGFDSLQGLEVSPVPPLVVPVTATPDPELPVGRSVLVEIPDTQALHSHLHDDVDEAFGALRERVALEAGWDALASLENAFVPLTTPLDPGLGEDWLYTGRAFVINSLLVQAGWVAAVPDEYGQQTYWRVYLRCRAQDGSMGEPLHQIPWDFMARYSGNPAAYDQGGARMSEIPAGYWVDLTALAQAYGWERLPALPNWRVYFNGARLGEFVITSGLDWYSAMRQIYPPEALVTPTVVVLPTPTPTVTPWGYKTPTPTLTPTPRPTLTPIP